MLVSFSIVCYFDNCNTTALYKLTDCKVKNELQEMDSFTAENIKNITSNVTIMLQ